MLVHFRSLGLRGRLISVLLLAVAMFLGSYGCRGGQGRLGGGRVFGERDDAALRKKVEKDKFPTAQEAGIQ